MSHCWRKGGTPKAAIQELFISQKTFYNHLYNISKKLGVHSMIDVVRLNQPAIRMQAASPPLRFSPRGKEVFLLYRDGLTRAQIAERLNMGVNGVKRHRERMLLQNGCKSMLELFAKYHGASGMDGENPDGDYSQD